MKKVLRALTIFSLIFVIFTSFIGCSSSSNNSNEKKQTQSKEAPKIVEDKKGTEKLKENKELMDGKVYTQNGYAIATMIIKDDVSEKDAKALAEEYAKKLKKQYSDMKVNVQAVKNGKNIANITID